MNPGRSDTLRIFFVLYRFLLIPFTRHDVL
nr:MAG TPA: hypothetical protein [Caudoviricetes sp.]